jgi:thiamine pyrophosphate-dependent acetolactate synthase large subunit-like protein
VVQVDRQLVSSLHEPTSTPEPAIRYGSDVVVRILTQLGIRYAAFNPGFTFRGIHDSMVNFGPAPAIVECCHEEIAVAFAHGFAKAAHAPMSACVHDIVGLQHASMAIFNAWCDRVPMLVLGGTGPRDTTKRRIWDWLHTALVEGELVRPYVKWDDEPHNLASVPESLARAYRTACTRPCGPVYVNFDLSLQEDAVPDGYQPSALVGYTPPPPPAVPADELERVARHLAAAHAPVIVVDRVEDPTAVAALAETLAAPVLVYGYGNRVGLSTDHPLNVTGTEEHTLARADLVLALEVSDLYGVLYERSLETGASAPRAPHARIIHIGLDDLMVKGWVQDYQRLTPIDIPLVGDADRAARELAVLLKDRVDSSLGRAGAAAQAHAVVRQTWRDEAARRRTESGPVHPAALAAVVWDAVAGQDYCLVNDSSHGWARRLWNIADQDHHLGTSGGAGSGYGIGAAAGAALALRDSGKLIVNIQADGDLLYTPSALWTVAKYELPMLIVLDNNHSYFNSQNHARTVARQRGRPIAKWGIGTAIDAPNIDFCAMARSFGIWAEASVATARDLPAAVRSALDVVRTGRPALVDVSTIGQV